jgi:hypothetical protein
MHVHSNEGDVIKMHQNCVIIVLMSYTLSKLYVKAAAILIKSRDVTPLFRVIQRLQYVLSTSQYNALVFGRTDDF